jgi:hypothetical protein
MTHADEQPAASTLEHRIPGRAARLAAIHMFADWLAAHPDVPVPDIMATYSISSDVEPDQATRYREIELLAERLGAREYGSKYGDHSPQFDYVVAAPKVHGIEITYRGSTFSDEHDRRL